MPLLDDNLALRINNRHIPQLQADLQLDQAFRANLLFDKDVYGGTEFLALNPGRVTACSGAWNRTSVPTPAMW